MRVADLFSGCGGLSQGFIQAGLDVVVAAENWVAARRVYSLNFDHPVLDLDLGGVDDAVSALAGYDPDVVIGGPPCQDFSAAGGRSEGNRAKLTVSFAKIVAELRPAWFVLENVPEARDSLAWASARKILRKAGYGISECVLNAAFFNVPQSRKRFFAVGRLEEDDHFLDDTLSQKLRTTKMTLREHVGDDFGIDFYYRHPRNWGRKAIFSLDEPSATIRSTNRRVPPGYSAHGNDAGPLEQARPLTTEERARVQTFPLKFRFDGTTTDRDMMIANAVPVALAQHVASTIRAYEERRMATPGDLRFRVWLTDTKGFTPRTAGNVISRLRRAAKMLRVKKLPADPDVVVDSLRRRKAFGELSPSIRSQMKRALVLQQEFREECAEQLRTLGTRAA